MKRQHLEQVVVDDPKFVECLEAFGEFLTTSYFYPLSSYEKCEDPEAPKAWTIPGKKLEPYIKVSSAALLRTHTLSFRGPDPLVVQSRTKLTDLKSPPSRTTNTFLSSESPMLLRATSSSPMVRERPSSRSELLRVVRRYPGSRSFPAPSPM